MKVTVLLASIKRGTGAASTSSSPAPCRVEVPLRDLPRGQEVDEWYDVVPPHQEKPAAPRPHQVDHACNRWHAFAWLPCVHSGFGFLDAPA
jgi:hypothetical protein